MGKSKRKSWRRSEFFYSLALQERGLKLMFFALYEKLVCFLSQSVKTRKGRYDSSDAVEIVFKMVDKVCETTNYQSDSLSSVIDFRHLLYDDTDSLSSVMDFRHLLKSISHIFLLTPLNIVRASGEPSSIKNFFFILIHFFAYLGLGHLGQPAWIRIQCGPRSGSETLKKAI
jgi:hypothetical protein